jgi:hypothetical protein
VTAKRAMGCWVVAVLLTGSSSGWADVADRAQLDGAQSDRTPSDRAGDDRVTVRGEVMQVWPMDDLRARGFEIPELDPDDNTYWTYLDAINAYAEVPENVVPAFQYAYGTAWPTGHATRLAAFLASAENRKAIQLAREAAAGESHQLVYFGDPAGSLINVLLPNLSHYRHLGKLLVADGRRLEATGRYADAADNYLAVMRMGHHVATGITLIENLVGLSLWALGDQAVGQLVLRKDLSAEQLAVIRDELVELRDQCPSTLAGIRNERVFGLSLVDEFTAQPLSLPRTVASGGDVYFAVAHSRAADNWADLEARVGRLLIPDRTIKRHMNHYYDELIEVAEQPAHAAAWNDFDDEDAVDAIPRWNVVAHIVLPSLSRASILGQRGSMRARATRLAVALRLFAKQHEGMPPARLEELLPGLPAEDLIDPYSGEPFRYDRRGSAWRFYGIGENYIDDGGKAGAKPEELDHVVRFPPPAVESFEPVADESASE